MNISGTMSIKETGAFRRAQLSPNLKTAAALLIALFSILCIAPVLDAAPGEPVKQGQTKTEPVKDAGDEKQKKSGGHGGKMPAYWSVIPFALILLGVAVLPIVAGHWWHNNWNKLLVSLVLGIPTSIYLIYLGRTHDLVHQLVLDYIPFIALLGALFYISGGIVLRGDIRATPANNVIFLAIGSALASFIGTTGASMVLIRPLLRTNSERKHVVHTVIFFIFCVSNIGGLLTPLGDPPLFLGYLKGVPFTWTFQLFPQWALTLGILLTMYFIWDTIAYRKEEVRDIQRDETEIQPLVIRGHLNFLWLLGVILVVAFVNEQYEPFKTLIQKNDYFKLMQVPCLLALVGLSAYFTPKRYREENNFNLHPIEEVAFLFVGIFMTMIPALILLKAEGAALGIRTPVQYFVATGVFSSFLDNAPTYLVFLALAEGMLPAGQQTVHQVVAQLPLILTGISLGAVFMGANTYIGNAPNFMVKAIAEERGVPMPSFGMYLVYSVIILGPVFALVAWLFL